jgi:hypothetical protein
MFYKQGRREADKADAEDLNVCIAKVVADVPK